MEFKFVLSFRENQVSVFYLMILVLFLLLLLLFLFLLFFFRGRINFEKLTSTMERDIVKSHQKLIGDGEEVNFDKKLVDVK